MLVIDLTFCFPHNILSYCAVLLGNSWCNILGYKIKQNLLFQGFQARFLEGFPFSSILGASFFVHDFVAKRVCCNLKAFGRVPSSYPDAHHLVLPSLERRQPCLDPWRATAPIARGTTTRLTRMLGFLRTYLGESF